MFDQHNVHESFSNMAEQFGQHIALEAPDRRVTYAELEANSNQLANFLIRAGAVKGSAVAILAEDRCTIITAILGVMKAGCAFVPLDASFPHARLEKMFGLARPEWFLIELGFLDKVASVSAAAGLRAAVVLLDKPGPARADHTHLTLLNGLADRPNISRPRVQTGADDLSYIYFTSGSTGLPKAIAGRAPSLAHFIRWEIETFGIGVGTRVSQITSHAFDACLRDIFVPLCAGGTVCIAEQRGAALPPDRLLDWIDRERINLVHCVPSVFRMLLGEPLRTDHFPALRHILLAGEPLYPADVKRWVSLFGQRIQLVNLYGPTETTLTKFFYMVKPEDQDRRSIPIGRPMPGARAMVVDEGGMPCPAGAVGEMLIRTPYRALGYYRDPEQTARAFVPNPFSSDPTDIVYRTGDLARLLDSGDYEFVGRLDHQLKVRGVRVEAAEIEGLLLGHERVADACVIGRTDGSGNTYLCAYIAGAGLTQEESARLAGELREKLAGELPEALVPSAFVVLGELPRTPNGKVDRAALPEPGAVGSSEGEVTGPRTPVEAVLEGIWCEVLGVTRVGVEDDFFRLGGHSLVILQVISRIRTALDVELPLAAVFQAPTIAKLAEHIETLRWAGQDAPEHGGESVKEQEEVLL
jgi:amino acid adenylation domain-containing protein